MNRITIQNTVRAYTKQLLTVTGLAVVTLMTLLFIEGVPGSFATNELYAWHCESMTASPATIVVGGTSTLEWRFAADGGITVTIDELAGQSWTGVSGSTTVSPTTSTTYTARAHKTGTTNTFTCSVRVEVEAPAPPEPKAPSCPLSASADTTVVTFNGKKLVSDKTAAQAVSDAYTVSLRAGTYTVRSVSWDGYLARVNASQPNERWYVDLVGGGTSIATTRATTDVTDNVVEATMTDTLESALVVASDVTTVYARHAVYPDTSAANSVVPICVSFTRHDDPIPDPEWPACPYTADAQTTVVAFDGKGLIANGSEADAQSSVYTVSLPAGTYTVKSASWDGYSWRASDDVQPYEQWFLTLRDASGVLYTSGNTTDLDDGVISSLKTDTLATGAVLARTATQLQAVHTKYPYDSRQSVQPICVALIKQTPTYDPWCSMGASPSAIDKGNSTTLWWDSADVTSVDITSIGTGLTPAGTREVSPSTTTTYTGTFYAKDATTHTCSTTVTVNPPSETPTPVCTLSASPTQVSRDGETTLTWTSDHATQASIDQGIGSVSVDGDKRVTVPSTRTYTATFTSDAGKTVTCSTQVTVKTGGGGSCLNCKDKPKDKPVDRPKDKPKDDDDRTPSIVLAKTITKMGGYVSLDEVPYTGFEAGPVATMFFWLAVLGVSAVLAYYITMYHPFARISQAVRAQLALENHAAQVTKMETIGREMLADAAATTPPVAHTIPAPSAVVLSNAGQGGHVSMVEERAHAESILLSPEASRMITETVAGMHGGEETMLSRIFTLAKDTYPREDGWILLSRERATTILARAQAAEGQGTPAAAVAAALPVRDMSEQSKVDERPIRSTPPSLSDHGVAPNPTPVTVSISSVRSGATVVSTDTAALVEFVDHVIMGRQQKAFDLLRDLNGKGVAAELFIADLVRKLDDIYKNRLEGNHSPDPSLAAKTATWSNGDFEKVIGMLVESIDYSYSSTRIGTKVALAKVFDHFGKMK